MELEGNQVIRILPSAARNAHAGEHLVFTDPWADLDAGQERRDNWMLSYIDILTLILTLFVLLLVLQPKYEFPISRKGSEFAGLSSLTLFEQQAVKTLGKDEMESEVSTALTETTHQGDELTLLAESEVDAVVVGIETAFFAEETGTLTSAVLESLMQPQQSTESEIEKIFVDPLTWTIAAPVKIFDRPPMVLSTKLAEQPQSNALETILAELNKHSLDGRLKVSQVSAGVQLEVNDKILFAEGSARLKPGGKRMLSDLAQVLLTHKGLISVEGHTDNRPISSAQFPSNWELSSGRATTVTRHLISHGLDPKKLRTVAYADTRPLETNATNQGRTRNRRVSLTLEPAQHQ